MSEFAVDQHCRLWNAIVWALRITVVLQCLGTCDWFVRAQETPFLHWLLDPADVGGLNWSEATALAVQRAIGWLLPLAGLCVLIRPCLPVLAPVALLQLLVAVAMWRVDHGFSLQCDWLPPKVTALFPFVTHLARIAAPLGLLLLDPWRAPRPLGTKRISVAIGGIRWAAAITFFAHGIEAWQLHPVFIDLCISSSQNVLRIELSQSTAEKTLAAIGALDFLVAVACVTTRWSLVWWWMAFWGAVTALSRVTAYGPALGWGAACMRAPHIGLPLSVVLYGRLVEWSHSSNPAKTTEESGQIQSEKE